MTDTLTAIIAELRELSEDLWRCSDLASTARSVERICDRLEKLRGGNDLLKTQLQESVERLQAEKEHLLFLLKPHMDPLPDGAVLASCSGEVFER